MERTAFTVGSNGNKIAIPWIVIINLIVVAAGWGVATAEIHQTQSDIEALKAWHDRDLEKINTLSERLTQTLQQLVDFKNDYEHDANKYIREPNDRRR